ncbi:hypothetical protein Rleg2_1125 [Rhizobium leguminosarum bv. trifolii WSM2304]|uniref:Uncharacterized protein n=1 Tax=Rhizobium leguminosarum bv. trifolii (strain WSM2304) TaxID=395492 RepID=A0ABF7QKB0_RHILW|nr:hypothetical protein Rleg2_1125 [Rhizobium leguminosarum bv. trifolii WSM2304]
MLAERLVGDLLPPSMALWLAAQEVKARTGMEPFPLVPKPEKTPEMLEAVTTALRSLSEILEPSARRRPELAVEIAKLFAAFNLYTGDAAKSAVQVEVWGEQLGEFPLFAIRKAVRWAVRGEQKMPSLAAFIGDTKIAMGRQIQARRKLLTDWVAM